jgi:ubiquinone biosynthesis protein UbiJ
LSEAPLFEKATPEVALCFLVNRLLAAEPWARLRLVPYVGEVVELRAPPFPALRLRILEGGTVEAGSAKPSLTMTLKPELLPALTRGDEHVVRAVDIRGNDRLAAELLVLAQHLRWDAEEALSRLVGDVAAHRLAGAGRALAGWHMDAARRLLGALGDYLTDEKQLLARRAELDALGESVAHLRDGIARLDKRIGRLD